MKPIFGLVVGLFITGLILMALGIVVGISFTNVKTAANATGVYTQVQPLISSFGQVFQVLGGIFMIAPFIIFIFQVLYARGIIGNQYFGGGPYQ